MNVMRALIKSSVVDTMTFVAMMLGFTLLLTGFFLEEWQLLAVPGLCFLLPSLVYGMR
jgi:hypothetical protein